MMGRIRREARWSTAGETAMAARGCVWVKWIVGVCSADTWAFNQKEALTAISNPAHAARRMNR